MITRTHYGLCASGADYGRCHRFLKAEGMSQAKSLTFPTVFALREGEVVGLIGSTMTAWGLVADPLHVREAIRNPAFMMLRLIDAYERILRETGLTEYKVAMPKAKPMWRRIPEELRGLRPIWETPTHWWYRVVLTAQAQQEVS